MKEHPADEILKIAKTHNIQPESLLQLIVEYKESILFVTALKRMKFELEEYETLILKILKPSVDKETRKARQRNSYKPSKFLINQATGEPLKLLGFRDEYRQQFIQLAYIGLYHKIENAEIELLQHLNKVLESNYKDLADINFNQKDKNTFGARDRLREVANCFKHNQGKANLPVSNYYSKCTLHKEIKLNFIDFKRDLKDVKTYYRMLSAFLSFFVGRKNFESVLDSELDKSDGELKNLLIQTIKEIRKVLSAVSKGELIKQKKRNEPMHRVK